MNDHNTSSGSSSPDVPPPLPSVRASAGATVDIAAPSPGPRPPARPQAASVRSDEPLPAGIRGWCWGGFLLNWVWAIRFRVWWGLLALVPLVGLLVPIWLGVKGRELAWRRGSWPSVQEFNEAQRKWSIGGGVVTVLACLVYGGSFAYERWQAHRDEVAAQGPGMTQEDIAKAISAPVDLKQLGVGTSVDLNKFQGAPAGAVLKDAYWGPKIAAITPAAYRPCVDQTLPELPQLQLDGGRSAFSAAHGSHAENWVAGLLLLGADGQVDAALVCDPMASDRILLMTSRGADSPVSQGVANWLKEQGSGDTKVTVFDGTQSRQTSIGALLGAPAQPTQADAPRGTRLHVGNNVLQAQGGALAVVDADVGRKLLLNQQVVPQVGSDLINIVDAYRFKDHDVAIVTYACSGTSCIYTSFAVIDIRADGKALVFANDDLTIDADSATPEFTLQPDGGLLISFHSSKGPQRRRYADGQLSKN